MYKRIYSAYNSLTTGDKAELKRANLQNLSNCTGYMRVLKYTGCKDNKQTARILYLLINTDISEEDGDSVGKALEKSKVNIRNIKQIIRSENNSIEYLKRQLVRCKSVDLKSIGELAQYWGNNARRNLLKDFIFNQKD